ncbi:DUF1822 family protein [Leptolyngbya sp. FACHB-671]|uniref:DUF1822 family protein n=1 Tax=Leptolyngbya sp. FACHB-671 TaxID=2692812 RepID=UPI00168493B5|nr:DUF1822 family protein [Leptolyngbya sp. FACHB-671]MBD2069530.1 DUF1822 family protein [Leptolyngbya sp. FACHB-671]
MPHTMMTNDPSHDSFDDPLPETLYVDALPPESISLTRAQIQHATQLSQRCPDPDHQWQAYLAALAQIGFEQWLQERSPDLAARVTPKPLPEVTLPIPIALLQVGDYTLCLLTISSVMDDRIPIPIAVVNEPDYIPHFYVLIEVWEEQDYVNIYGYLRRDRLMQQAALLSTGAIANAQLSLDWFDSNVDTLLLYLRCLNPDAILSSATLHTITQDPATHKHSSELVSHFSTPFLSGINVGCWLRDRLDEVAQELSWVLLPPLAVTFREIHPPTEQFDQVTMALLKQGIVIPSQARGAYQNLAGENIALRLYALTWQENQSTKVPEWSLLLILGAQPGDELPVGTRLIVEDDLQLLDEQILREKQPEAFLFTRVIGTWNEQFRVAIAFSNGEIVRLPPFRFQPDA